MRIVVDTNVLVSALIFPGGPPETLYRMVLEGEVALVTSPPLLTELGRVLGEKFGWQPERAEEAVGQLLRIAEIVEPREKLAVVAADPADDRVLEAAAEGEVDAIVSGDRHLLEVGEWRGVPIRTTAEFLGDAEH